MLRRIWALFCRKQGLAKGFRTGVWVRHLEQFPLGRDSNRSNYPKSGQRRAEGGEESCQRVMSRGLREEGGGTAAVSSRYTTELQRGEPSGQLARGHLRIQAEGEARGSSGDSPGGATSSPAVRETCPQPAEVSAG